MAGEVVGRAHRFADPSRQHGGVERLLDAGLDDGEFVAAEARDGVGLAHAAAQPLGHDLEQLVADRMAERVVDALEVVEVEIEHRKLAAAPDAGQRLGQPLAKQQAVGQVGERVVARHVRDLLLGAPALGDVLVGRDPAAVGHRMVEHGDGAAVGQLDAAWPWWSPVDERLEHLGDVLLDIAGEGADAPCGAPSRSRSVQPGFTRSGERPYIRR